MQWLCFSAQMKKVCSPYFKNNVFFIIFLGIVGFNDVVMLKMFSSLCLKSELFN